MRQIGDMLVWFGVILVLAAVVYFTPRFADYVNAAETTPGPPLASRPVVHIQNNYVDEIP
jgi:hypothetical protein